MKNNVTYLKVPYSEKDNAKDLGARWDPVEKLWYVPKGVELEDFNRWLDNSKQKQQQELNN